MMPSIRTVRLSLLSRGTKYLIALILVLGAVLLYLLSSASSNTPMFARNLPLLLYLGVGLVVVLMLLVGYQLLSLRRRVKAGLFGSKLTLRLVLLFSLVAVLPGALVYAVSVLFLSKSIESWFNVRVDTALEGSLSLGRTTLENMLRDVTAKAESMALSLSDTPAARTVAALNTMREQAAVQEVTLFRSDGTILAFSLSDTAGLMPTQLSEAALRQTRLFRQPYRRVESNAPTGLRLRVVVPLNALAVDTALLQVVQAVPDDISRDAETVESMYRDYQQLAYQRTDLKKLYTLSLTLSLLLALLSALVLSILFSEGLSAPLGVLAAGTRAVAKGDFSQHHPVRSDDELGILTESFNAMTRQLADARAELLHNQEQLEAANIYLESILAKLSAGVLSFDQDRHLRSANPSAQSILSVNLVPLLGVPLIQWSHREPQVAEFATAVLEGISSRAPGTWEKQVDVAGGAQVLLVRGSALQVSAESGFVVVFDDITRLLQAQRYAAWGEVARRLAHEIKNPLTPIQLSAERLEHRLAHKLEVGDAEVLARSTQTIVQQVAQLKGMVDAFSQYARMPEMRLQGLDLNQLVREVLALYEGHAPTIRMELPEGLPLVRGDAARLRQVIHNLLQNAEQAVVDVGDPRIVVRTSRVNEGVRFAVVDNGTGFPREILSRAMEPYVTTKPKGTGLGLAIVRRIVEEHAGRIDIANLASGGAEVSITLPVTTVPLRDAPARMPAGHH